MFSIYLTGLVLIGIVSWVVAEPFFHPAPADSEDDGSPEDALWRKQKNDALAGIRDVELDFHLGKLSESDYGELRGRLEKRALEAIRALEGESGDHH